MCAASGDKIAFTLFLVCDATELFLFRTLPVSRKQFIGRDVMDLFGTGVSKNVSLISFLAS
jgi:hypothetical protein